MTSVSVKKFSLLLSFEFKFFILSRAFLGISFQGIMIIRTVLWDQVMTYESNK